MLYTTTRNNLDTFTAQRALREDRGEDGGLYVPFQRPALSVGGQSMNGCVAETLNLLFQTRLTAWDVDCSIGRHPVRLEHLRQRTVMAESWHNPDWTFERMVRSLTRLAAGEEGTVNSWTRIAVRIAALSGIFWELQRSGIREPVDIALVSGDFSAPISAWYARRWGLPIGNIICCCNENNSLWELLVQGQLRTDAVAHETGIPQADVVVPTELERLVCEAGGPEEVEYYLERCRRGQIYCPDAAVLPSLREGLCASVVSSQRIGRTIRGAYDTHGYLLSPASALAYGGLLDYRSRTGNLRPTLVLTEESPLLAAPAVAGAIGVTEETLKRIL